MEYQLTLRYPFPFIGDIKATFTDNPAIVNEWITRANLSHLALRAGPAKIIYLAVLPQNPDERPRVLQILVRRNVLFYSLADELPYGLRAFLIDRLYEFVGRDVDSALTRLQVHYGVGGNAKRSLELSNFSYWPPPEFAREYKIRVPCPHPYNGNTRAIFTHTPATVTQWIINVDEYFKSVPELHPKIVFLTALPELPNERPRILQILVPHFCLFFDLVHAPSAMPLFLRQFLENNLYTFVGSDVSCVLSRLKLNCTIGGHAMRRFQLIRDSEVYRVDWMLKERDVIKLCHSGFLRCRHALTTAGVKNILEN